MRDVTPLEESVIEMLLRGNEPVLAILRTQAERASVTSRRATGVGLFTRFGVPSDVERLPGTPSFRLGDVAGSADNVENGLGFLLYVDDGVLTMLEGYTYGDERWPDSLEGLSLSYLGGEGRDEARLRDELG